MNKSFAQILKEKANQLKANKKAAYHKKSIEISRYNYPIVKLWLGIA